MQKFLKRAFIDSKDKLFYWVNDFLAVITIVSILVVVLETVPSLDKYHTWFFVIEWIAVIFFALEYLGRLTVSKPKTKYVFSFFGIIDLVAILPTLLGLGNFTFLKSARVVRIIRLLRMLRLVKISRVPKGTDPEESLGVFGFNIFIYASVLLFGLLVTGTLIYLVEPALAVFSSIPAGMWWSLQIFMSIGSVTIPESQGGMIVYVTTKFMGMLLLGLLIGVVGNLFKLVLLDNKGK